MTQRVEVEAIDDLSEYDVSEDDNSTFPSDVMQERGHSRAYHAAALIRWRHWRHGGNLEVDEMVVLHQK